MSIMFTTRKGTTIICGARANGKSVALSLLNKFQHLTDWEKERLLSGMSGETFVRLYFPTMCRRFCVNYFEAKPSVLKTLDVKKVDLWIAKK